MHLGRIIPLANRIRVDTTRNNEALSSIELAKGVFYKIYQIDNEEDYEYYAILIHLFDRAIISNNIHNLSMEQEDLLKLYFKEGNNITPEEDIDLEDYEYNYSLLSKHILRLDEFLGSFLGVEDGQFSRYGRKQFHSQRQPFSSTIENIGGA